MRGRYRQSHGLSGRSIMCNALGQLLGLDVPWMMSQATHATIIVVAGGRGGLTPGEVWSPDCGQPGGA